MIQQVIQKLVDRGDLSRPEAVQAMDAIMSGQCTPAQVAAFIVALRMKGETVDEIAGCAQVMREKAVRVDPGAPPDRVVDTCGTGGDVKGTFNISTAAALVSAAAGVTVAKHGNRSVSSHSGSADVLAALGVKIDAPLPVVEKCLREARIGFLFAPAMHAAMKHAIGPRREIGVRTVFNMLGPLTNPAGARCQVLGVYDRQLLPVMAAVLRELGSLRCFVVHGADGLDEITLTDQTHVAELAAGSIREYDIAPDDFGLGRCALGELTVDSPQGSAEIIRGVLAGSRGPHRDIVLLNAAAALQAAGSARDWKAGLEAAARAVDSGRAAQVLDLLVRLSNRPD